MVRPATVAIILGIALFALPASQATANDPVVATPEGIMAVAHGDGWVFTDAKGLSLYFYDGDEAAPNKSACNGGCAKQWPPAKATDDARPQGPWAPITRDDGSHQWAYRGKPVYTYARETHPGTTFGDGEGAKWRVAFQPIWTPSSIRLKQTDLGDVLTDARGLTLYTFDLDSGAKSKCEATCLRVWQPVIAPALANPVANWSVIVRADSTTQWAYKGKPLYRYANDVNPGETNGEGVGETWRAAVLEPPPPRPAWVSVQPSLVGSLLADARGITLYYHGAPVARGSLASSGPECATATCMGTDWKAVLADVDAKDAGNWTVVANTDGTRQWSYRGMRLYRNVMDEAPGDFKGVRFGGDHVWTIIMRDGGPIPSLN